MKQALKDIMYSLGLSAEQTPNQRQFDELETFIRDHYKHMTPEKLKEIFNLAIVQKFKIDLTLYKCVFSPAYVSKVITGFYNWEDEEKKRIEMLEKRPKYKEPETVKILNEQQKLAQTKEAFAKSFEYYKTSGRILDPANVLFNYLYEKNIFRPEEGTREMFKEEAREYLKIEKRNMLEKDRTQRTAVETYIKNLEDNAGHDDVICEAKRLALKFYYDQLIEQGKGIEIV